MIWEGRFGCSQILLQRSAAALSRIDSIDFEGLEDPKQELITRWLCLRMLGQKGSHKFPGYKIADWKTCHLRRW
jgi:hypothetical protein